MPAKARQSAELQNKREKRVLRDGVRKRLDERNGCAYVRSRGKYERSDYYAQEFTDAELDALADAGDFLLECGAMLQRAYDDAQLRAERLNQERVGNDLGMNYSLFGPQMPNSLDYKGYRIGWMPDNGLTLCFAFQEGKTDGGRWRVYVDEELIPLKAHGVEAAIEQGKRFIDKRLKPAPAKKRRRKAA